jgi:hypothetical protein
MNEKTVEAHRTEFDPKMMRYWMRQGPKAAAFPLVIPGCTVIGCWIGLLLSRPLPYSVIGLGAGLLIWGLIVSFS